MSRTGTSQYNTLLSLAVLPADISLYSGTLHRLNVQDLVQRTMRKNIHRRAHTATFTLLGVGLCYCGTASFV